MSFKKYNHQPGGRQGISENAGKLRQSWQAGKLQKSIMVPEVVAHTVLPDTLATVKIEDSWLKLDLFRPSKGCIITTLSLSIL